jgi:GTP cyclohydrolase I
MSLDKSKCDPELGKRVHDFLVSHEVESPIDYAVYKSTTTEEKIKLITENMKQSLLIMGFDLSNDSVMDTPSRVAKMWVTETMCGLDYSLFPKTMTFDNKFKAAGMVIERDIQSMSVCSHHIVTIDGVATVAYIPKHKVIGLSKINRIVEFFSRRPQEAERLTLQIYHALQYILETDDIAVFLSGVHYCVKSRGVGDVNSSTSTVKLGGSFMSDSLVRNEFYSVVNSKAR